MLWVLIGNKYILKQQVANERVGGGRRKKTRGMDKRKEKKRIEHFY
jgi:hypothetical protein